MTLDEAIETLKNDQRRNYTQKENNIYKAQGLGIEALKRVEAYKKAHFNLHYTPMPGETEE